MHRQHHAVGIPVGEQVHAGRDDERDHRAGRAADQIANAHEQAGEAREQDGGRNSSLPLSSAERGRNGGTGLKWLRCGAATRGSLHYANLCREPEIFRGLTDGQISVTMVIRCNAASRKSAQLPSFQGSAWPRPTRSDPFDFVALIALCALAWFSAPATQADAATNAKQRVAQPAKKPEAKKPEIKKQEVKKRREEA